MSWHIWAIIILITVVYFGWMFLEVRNAPLMPDDYGTTEGDINKKIIKMEIVMVKKQGCMPCTIFKPTREKYALENNIGFRTIQAEDMPEPIRPEFYPYFYLRSGGKVLEEWGGTNERKMETVIKRNLI